MEQPFFVLGKNIKTDQYLSIQLHVLKTFGTNECLLQESEKSDFLLERKLPIIDDRKLVHIGLIRTNLRLLHSSILGALVRAPKSRFFRFMGISYLHIFFEIIVSEI